MAEGEIDRDWTVYLRLLIHSARDSAASSDPAGDAALLDAVRRLNRICKEEGNSDLVAKVYPPLNKLFQRCCSAVSAVKPGTVLLVLAILQFFLDHGEAVLHDADPSLRGFFRSCLSKQYTDPLVAKYTIDFLNENKAKLLHSHPSLLPQYFPLLLKVIAWGDDSLDHSFLKLLPALVAPTSFLTLFPALLDFPTLVLALETLEQKTGSAIGNNTSLRKSPAPEALLALMDEAYIGTAFDRSGDSGDEGTISAQYEAESLFADLLKDENEGLSERHWSVPGMAAALQLAMGTVQSTRMKHALILTPKMLEVYFKIALRDVNESLLCALLPNLFFRVDAMFPDSKFMFETQKKCLEFMLAVFHQSPHIIAILKKPIMDRVGQPHNSPAKMELALQLCWAIGEHGGGGLSHKGAARELFETLELLLYENLSASRAATGMPIDGPSQARLLCFVVTAIAKLATYHRELSPRARVCLSKVARSQQVLNKAVWRRARDYLGLMHEPAICASIWGPSNDSQHWPGTIRWQEGGTAAVANIPFYLLGGKQGPPFHDFSLADVQKI